MASPPAQAKIRLIATDLDGTIVRRDGGVSERTVKVLSSLVENGLRVVFVTGRPPRWMAPIVADTGLTGTAICSNGAQIYDTGTGEIEWEAPLDASVASQVARDIRARFPDASFAVEVGFSFGHEPAFSPGWEPPSGSLVADVEQLVAGSVVKLLARCSHPSADALLDEVRALVGERATVTRSIGVGLVEISRRGVDKGSTLASLARTWGIDASEVVAFGDESNDAPMLAWAGRSVAVANAHPNASSVAGEMTASVDDDGVALVLEALLQR